MHTGKLIWREDVDYMGLGCHEKVASISVAAPLKYSKTRKAAQMNGTTRRESVSLVGYSML